MRLFCTARCTSHEMPVSGSLSSSVAAGFPIGTRHIRHCTFSLKLHGKDGAFAYRRDLEVHETN
jgi:hypothetical protein